MNFTRDFLNEVLICRESIKVLLNEGTVLTINAGDEFTRINDIVAVSENYGEEIEALEERVQIKRKYGQYGSMAANSSAPVRDRIVEFVGKKFCNEEELQNFLLKLEEDRGTSFNQKQWFDRNQKYFQSFKNEGQQVWTLSKFGKRVLEHILKNKTKSKPMVNESKIGLFKFNTINEAMMPISNRSIGKYKSKVDTTLIDKLVKQISPVLNSERSGTLTPKVYEEIIIAISKVISGDGVLSTPQFVFENELNEGAVDLSKQFALVRTGGSIGTRNSFPIFVGRDMGNVIETGDDKDALVEMKSRMNKSLSPGDKKYYGISHKVIELTAYKRKQINDLIALQNKSENEDVISESRIVYPEEQIKKECISRLSDFFRVPANALSHLKFDGKDSIKDITKALNATSYEGAEAYYKIAIEMAKRDLGL
jgi:hypothetical protein